MSGKLFLDVLADSIRNILDQHARLQAAVAACEAAMKANSDFDPDLFFEKCGVVVK